MNEGGMGFGKRDLVDKIIESAWDKGKKDFNKNDLLYIIQEMNDEEGREYLTKKVSTGANSYKVYREFVKYLLYRNLANYDSMVLMSGLKGTGKSSAAIMLAREWCKLMGIKFNPKRHIAYNNADIMNKIDNLKPFEPIIADEAVRFASSEDWAKAENKELKKKLAQVRTKHLLYILCFPLKIQKMEKSYLESFVNYWVDLFGRGLGALYVKDNNPVHDTWRMNDFKLVGSYSEFTSPSQIAKKLKKHPNFWNIIKIPKPPAWLYDNYLKVRESNVYDDNAILKNVSKEDIHKALLVLALRDIMTHDTTVTMNRIILHIKGEYDLPITKAMVESVIEDSKQLVDKIRENSIDYVENKEDGS